MATPRTTTTTTPTVTLTTTEITRTTTTPTTTPKATTTLTPKLITTDTNINTVIPDREKDTTSSSKVITSGPATNETTTNEPATSI